MNSELNIDAIKKENVFEYQLNYLYLNPKMKII